MPRCPDPMKAHLSGTSAKKGVKTAPVVHELQPLSADPPASLTEAEAAHWRAIVGHAPPGLLTTADGTALQFLCELLAEKDALKGDMPASRLGVIRSLMNDLALMPSARRRLGLAMAVKANEEGEPNPWDDF